MGRIIPKLKSLPRRKTPSAIYIEMHQLANERERLNKELIRLGDRTQEIKTRLQELDKDIKNLEVEIGQPIAATKQISEPKSQLNKLYKSLVIEY